MSALKGIRLRTFVIFACAALAGTALLHTSQRVQEAEETLASLEAEIAREQDTMRVLRAEWEYLNRPERLERLATKFLDLVPPSPDTMSDTLIDEAATLPEKPVDNDQAQPASYEAEDTQ
ncbi:MAG: hypothetical protein GW778_08410 [Alphaproteobacteria bacterium]|nr:hypothetical protein [Alphaproteobacteria bacterium]